MQFNPRTILRLWRTKFREIRNKRFEESLTKSACRAAANKQLTGANRIPVVVSMTTHGFRMGLVHIAIESILRQTARPDRVILWISDATSSESLSVPLRNQMDRGLEIRRVPDVGPHTKAVYAIQEFPDMPVVTVDDDIMYPGDMLSKLYAAYKGDPGHVHCNRAHRIVLAPDGRPKPYSNWEWDVGGNCPSSHLLFPTGVGGVLYPPGSLDPEVTNIAVFREICPWADDIWFKAMALLNGVQSKRLAGKQRPLMIAGETQAAGLQDINIFDNRNDAQITAVFDRYDLYGRLRD